MHEENEMAGDDFKKSPNWLQEEAKAREAIAKAAKQVKRDPGIMRTKLSPEAAEREVKAADAKRAVVKEDSPLVLEKFDKDNARSIWEIGRNKDALAKAKEALDSVPAETLLGKRKAWLNAGLAVIEQLNMTDDEKHQQVLNSANAEQFGRESVSKGQAKERKINVALDEFKKDNAGGIARINNNPDAIKRATKAHNATNGSESDKLKAGIEAGLLFLEEIDTKKGVQVPSAVQTGAKATTASAAATVGEDDGFGPNPFDATAPKLPERCKSFCTDMKQMLAGILVEEANLWHLSGNKGYDYILNTSSVLINKAIYDAFTPLATETYNGLARGVKFNLQAADENNELFTHEGRMGAYNKLADNMSSVILNELGRYGKHIKSLSEGGGLTEADIRAAVQSKINGYKEQFSQAADYVSKNAVLGEMKELYVTTRDATKLNQLVADSLAVTATAPASANTVVDPFASAAPVAASAPAPESDNPEVVKGAAAASPNTVVDPFASAVPAPTKNDPFATAAPVDNDDDFGDFKAAPSTPSASEEVSKQAPPADTSFTTEAKEAILKVLKGLLTAFSGRENEATINPIHALFEKSIQELEPSFNAPKGGPSVTGPVDVDEGNTDEEVEVEVVEPLEHKTLLTSAETAITNLLKNYPEMPPTLKTCLDEIKTRVERSLAVLEKQKEAGNMTQGLRDNKKGQDDKNNTAEAAGGKNPSPKS